MGLCLHLILITVMVRAFGTGKELMLLDGKRGHGDGEAKPNTSEALVPLPVPAAEASTNTFNDVNWTELAGKRMAHTKSTVYESDNQFGYLLIAFATKGCEHCGLFFLRSQSKSGKIVSFRR